MNVQISLISVGQTVVVATASVESNEVPMPALTAPNIGEATVVMDFDSGSNEKLPSDAVNVGATVQPVEVVTPKSKPPNDFCAVPVSLIVAPSFGQAWADVAVFEWYKCDIQRWTFEHINVLWADEF